MRSFARIAAGLAVAALLLSTAAPAARAEVAPKDAFVSGSTKFAIDLFGRVLKKDPHGNVLISPFSVHTAMAMVYNGANAETMKTMKAALGFGEMKLDEVNKAAQELTKDIQEGDKGVSIQVANSLWLKKGVDIRQDFIKRLADFFGASAEALDFADKKSLDKINDWTSKNTKGKIKRILDKLDPEGVLYLLNAVWFKGDWAIKFDKKLTTKRTFNLEDGKTVEIPMMSQSGHFQYLDADTFKAVALPYANKRLAMYLFLPESKTTLTDFLGTLTQEALTGWLGQFDSREGTVILPTFKGEYDIDLTKILRLMGMEDPFDAAKADFSKLTAVKVFISLVLHKTFIEINEEGTEAAAVTVVGVRAAGASPKAKKKFTLVFERPYFYVIRDRNTGLILFMGVIRAPK
jgi:serpin B